MLKSFSKQANSIIAPVKPTVEGKRTRYYLGKKYPGVYLTSQEAICLFYSIQKFTSKNISVLMDIHFRTVEYYRDNVRCKLGAISKKDLINKIQETNFTNYMRHLEKICRNWKKSRFSEKPRA